MGDWFAAAANKTTDVVAPNNSKNDNNDDDLPFLSRRSPVLCRNGCVASSQPLASSIGLDILRKGGNAADAAIAVAATLCVVEPCSTGLGCVNSFCLCYIYVFVPKIVSAHDFFHSLLDFCPPPNYFTCRGDMFCLFYDSKDRKVSAINGSGCSAAELTMDVLKEDCSDGQGGVDEMKFQSSVHAVTVPGAARGYEDLLKHHGSGKFTLAQLVEPAAQLAEEGFPVAPVTAHHWSTGMHLIERWLDDGAVEDGHVPLTVDGKRGPKAGDIIVNADYARALRDLGTKGATDGFYAGVTGEAIVAVTQKHGGKLTLDDLKSHTSTFPDPVSAEYRGVRLWEVPPNGQGVAALVALTGLQELEKRGICPKMSPELVGQSADAYHVMIEMMRLGFEDARAQVACPEHTHVDNAWFSDRERIGKRAKELYDPGKAIARGEPERTSCTVSFQVTDKEGNAISFVNSNFMGFGSGIVPEGCGFSLQNRGCGFTTNDDKHPNCLGPNKRPYHTIIPGMLTYADTNELYSTLTNMGGHMQPQGHLQLMVDMVAGGLDPQQGMSDLWCCRCKS